MSQSIDRLSFEQLAPRVQDLLRARVARLGYLGEFFRCTGCQPDVLAPFMEMTEALKEALPDRLTEVGALTVATLMKNDYERNQHERLSVKLGFGHAWVDAVEQLEPDAATALSETEKAVQRLVIAAVRGGGKNVGEELDALIELIGADQAVAILFLVGRYMTHAIIVNALNLAPPVPSVFEGAEQA